jgi:hypothetical protein
VCSLEEFNYHITLPNNFTEPERKADSASEEDARANDKSYVDFSIHKLLAGHKLLTKIDEIEVGRHAQIKIHKIKTCTESRLVPTRTTTIITAGTRTHRVGVEGTLRKTEKCRIRETTTAAAVVENARGCGRETGLAMLTVQ